MTLIHIVLFEFRADVSAAHKAHFARELKTLKSLACVKDHRLIVGGPSVTTLIERSQGFHHALLSYHRDRAALEEYQASKEHYKVTTELLWPYKENLIRFDVEVEPEDEYMCQVIAKGAMRNGIATPEEPSPKA